MFIKIILIILIALEGLTYMTEKNAIRRIEHLLIIMIDTGCTGRCYWDTGMCPRVDICDETRTTEFAAALIGLISVPALIFIGIGLLYWIATTM